MKNLNAIKYFFATLSICSFFMNTNAQSTVPVCGGSSKKSGSGSMSYTIGQIDYLYSTSPKGSAVAGVQQPFDENTSYQTNCDGVDLTIYPNPTSENLYVSCDLTDAKYQYILSDMTGKILIDGNLTGKYTVIPMNTLIDGSYALKIICGDGKDDYTSFKIIKKK